jgi:hypothetical protein
MNIDEKKLWEAKVVEKRILRQEEYKNLFNKLGFSPDKDYLGAKLYEIAKESLGDMSLMLRELVADSWKYASDDAGFDEMFASDEELVKNFRIDEEKLVHGEILNILTEHNLYPSKETVARGKDKLTMSSQILLNRYMVMLSYLKESRVKQIAKEKKEISKWKVGMSVQALSAFVLLCTAGLSYYTFYSTRREFVARNRPYLSFALEKYPGSINELNRKKELELSVLLTNHGETPALDVLSYAYAVVNGRVVFTIDAQKLLPEKDPKIIVYPKKSVPFLVSVPSEGLKKILNATEQDKSGIIFKVAYRGVWDKEKSRPYLCVANILPWRDGAFVKYRTNSEQIQ